ncbi:hypothetical protein [Nonomuraea sp. NPDC023979]|uniref:hypothetical protein n=1 Tax=Nonomuraea sp. NPDC023979 TaxID=3154796 RepID=UPI0033D6BB92
MSSRVRILLEWYDPNATRAEAEAFAQAREEKLRADYPGAIASLYVETDPPQSEVEGLLPHPMT